MPAQPRLELPRDARDVLRQLMRALARADHAAQYGPPESWAIDGEPEDDEPAD